MVLRGVGECLVGYTPVGGMVRLLMIATSSMTMRDGLICLRYSGRRVSGLSRGRGTGRSTGDAPAPIGASRVGGIRCGSSCGGLLSRRRGRPRRPCAPDDSRVGTLPLGRSEDRIGVLGVGVPVLYWPGPHRHLDPTGGRPVCRQQSVLPVPHPLQVPADPGRHGHPGPHQEADTPSHMSGDLLGNQRSRCHPVQGEIRHLVGPAPGPCVCSWRRDCSHFCSTGIDQPPPPFPLPLTFLVMYRVHRPLG